LPPANPTSQRSADQGDADKGKKEGRESRRNARGEGTKEENCEKKGVGWTRARCGTSRREHPFLPFGS
jgi:hypothetical protein